MKQNGITLERAAPEIGVTISSLSKIARGEIWVAGDTANSIRTYTKGEVTLNDLHDTWSERQEEKSAEAAA